MRERRRMIVALAASVLLHAGLLGLFPHAVTKTPAPRPPEQKPLYFEMDPDVQRQLLETYAASETPPENANTISDKNTQAADAELREGAQPGPIADIEDDAKLLAAVPAPEQQTQPASQPAQEQPEIVPEEPKPQEKQEKPQEKKAAKAKGATDKPPEPAEKTAPEDPEMQLAMAPPIPATPPTPEIVPAKESTNAPAADRKHLTRGNVDNAVVNTGFTNFEAIQDEIAPYLLEIRKYVERRWIEALVTRYSGTKPTKAIVECAIRPDGTLESARVSGLPDEPVFASICRQAIERAGPFRPFPFTVPDIYRNQNLEIRWTFNFL